MAGAGVAVKFAGTAPYCRGYGPAPHVEVPIARTAPYTGAARPVRGSPEGGPQAVLGEDASAPRGRCPRARAVKGPAWRLGCLVEERDHHP